MSITKKSFGILGREREIADLKKRYADMEKERKAAVDRLTEKKQQVLLAAASLPHTGPAHSTWLP